MNIQMTWPFHFPVIVSRAQKQQQTFRREAAISEAEYIYPVYRVGLLKTEFRTTFIPTGLYTSTCVHLLSSSPRSKVHKKLQYPFISKPVPLSTCAHFNQPTFIFISLLLHSFALFLLQKRQPSLAKHDHLTQFLTSRPEIF